MDNGHILQAQFTELGFPVKLVNTIKSAQITTYFFNVVCLAQYSKKKIENLLEKLSAYNHKKLSFSETQDSHFAVIETLKKNAILNFNNIEHKANNTTTIQVKVGKDITNNDVVLDFDNISHLLVAGTTGSGKSVFLKTLLSGLILTTHPNSFDLVLIDPKQVEFSLFRQARNTTIITETNDAIAYLNELCSTMDTRYRQLMSLGRTDYKGLMKPIFVVVDELADLMLTSGYDVEDSIVRLAQKGRACGIHLILATQRPTVNVISGLIKANMPCRIVFKVSSSRDSVVALDHKGAELLKGCGDALIKFPNLVNEIRFQTAYTDTNTVQTVITQSRGY